MNRVCKVCWLHSNDQMIACCSCNIPVHLECYGGTTNLSLFLCGSCILTEREDVICIACPELRSALKATTDGRWMHAICSLFIPEVRYAEEETMTGVDVSELTKIVLD